MSEKNKANNVAVVDKTDSAVDDAVSGEVIKEKVHPSVRMEVTMAEQRTEETLFCGPLPPAKELAAYEKIVPGAAERLLKMAEREQKNSYKLSNKRKRLLRLGMILGFVALMGLIFLTGWAVYLKEPWVATVLVG